MGLSYQRFLAFLVIVAMGECCLPYEKLLTPDDPEVLALLRAALAKIDESTDGLKVLSPTLMKYDFWKKTYDVKYTTGGDGKECFIKFSKRHWRPVSTINIIARHCESRPTPPTTTTTESPLTTTPSTTTASPSTPTPSTAKASPSTTESPSTTTASPSTTPGSP